MITDDCRLLTLSELARRVGVDPSTPWRWRQVGALCRATGKRIRLRAKQIGGCWFVSEEDWQQFLAELNPADEPVAAHA